jgi:RNA polymerase sigma-70 factor (ECF subfamily)
MDEKELAIRCGRGDNVARKLLYERYAGQLMAICLRYFTDQESAKDTLHDAFLRIFRTIDSFEYRGDGSLKAWLNKVTHSIIIKQLRENSQNMEISVDNWDMLDIDVEEERVNEIPQRVLMQFLQELPKQKRLVFNLYAFGELSHKEIGEILGISERGSSSELSRARLLLMNKIKQYKEKKNQ